MSSNKTSCLQEILSLIQFLPYSKTVKQNGSKIILGKNGEEIILEIKCKGRRKDNFKGNFF